MTMEGRALNREIEALRREHENILRELVLLRDALDKREAARTVFALASSLGRDLETNFSHELSILYEPMKKKPGLKGGPISTMIAEHSAISRAFKTLLSAIETLRNRSSHQYEDLRLQIDGLQRLVGKHVRREEKILFWMAELEL